MSLRIGRILSSAALSCLAACSGGSNPDGGAGGGAGGGASGPVPVDQLCSDTYATLCSYFNRCGAFANASSCAEILDLGGCAIDTLAGVDAGRIRYDGAQAATCINDFNKLSCSSGFAVTPPSCTATFVGLVQLGGACAIDNDCAGAAFCSTGSTVCGGTCAAKIAIGQPITFPQECVDGASDFDGHCVANLTLAQSCSNPDGGFDTLPCGSALSCTGITIDGGNNAVSICTTTADAGALCVDALAGVSGCGSFTFCDDQTNRCAPLLKTGAACDRNNPGRCQSDLWCNGGAAMPTCQVQNPVGGACVTSQSCAAGGFCDGGEPFNFDGGAWTLGSCLAPSSVGDACSTSCARGQYCDSQTSVCKTQKANGQPCSVGDECAASECNIGVDGGSQCGAPCQ